MNEQYHLRRTKYVASPFLQLYVCFTETTLEALSKTLVTVGLVQIDLLILVVSGVMLQPASFFKSVHNSSSTNGNIFFSLETIKSVYGISLMFAITICGIFLLEERNKSSENIIWSLSFSRSVVFLSFRS